MSDRTVDHVLSGKRRDEIASIARRSGALEAWLFGSALGHDGARMPRDVDVAFVGVPERLKSTLARDLARSFPGSRADDALSYGPGLQREGLPVPLHFVICDDSDRIRGHSILGSIGRGVCLWRARS